MKFRNFLGRVFKYVPYFCLMLTYLLSLYRDVTATSGDEQAILIWKDILLMATGMALMGNIHVLDKTGTLLTGTKNFLFDPDAGSEGETAVTYNGLVACSVFITVLFLLLVLYGVTGIKLFTICSSVFSVIYVIVLVAEIIAVYLQGKQESGAFSGMLGLVTIPGAISILMMFLINRTTVAWVYGNMHSSRTIDLTLAVIVVLLYFPIAAFCHFENLYCLFAIAYAKKKPARIETKINELLDRNMECEDTLCQRIEDIDAMAEGRGVFMKAKLVVLFFYYHLRAFVHMRASAVKYLALYVTLKIEKQFSGLLDARRVKANGIRFFEIAAIIELVVLDMCLFLFLGSDDPCSRFFELLSTVIIIPILLSAIANLKNSGKRNS